MIINEGSMPVKGNHFLKGDRVVWVGTNGKKKGIVKNTYGDVVVVQFDGENGRDKYRHLSMYDVKPINEAMSLVDVGSTIKNRNGKSYKVLGVKNGNDLLVRDVKTGEIIIAVNWDPKDKSWGRGRYFTSDSLPKAKKEFSKLTESAQDALYYDKEFDYSKEDIAAQISINYEGECNAITGYYKLIPFFKALGDQDAIDKINDIIEEELKHQDLLKELQSRYDGGLVAEK